MFIGFVGSTVRRFRFIAVAILAVVALTVILNVGNVYAPPPTCVLMLTPNPVHQGTSVTASATGCYAPFFSGTLYVQTICGNFGTTVSSVAASTDASGDLTTVTPISTSSLTPGDTYCVYGGTAFSATILSAYLTVLPATVIPEYPIGLSILAIFMVIGYGVIRRKTLTKQK
jgi:hypothetical protein